MRKIEAVGRRYAALADVSHPRGGAADRRAELLSHLRLRTHRIQRRRKSAAKIGAAYPRLRMPTGRVFKVPRHVPPPLRRPTG